MVCCVQRETFAKYRAGESVRVVDVLTCRVNTHEDLVPEYVLDEVRSAGVTRAWSMVPCALTSAVRLGGLCGNSR